MSTDNDRSRTRATFGQMAKTVTTRTLQEHRTVLKKRRTNNFSKKRRGVSKDKVKFGLTRVVKSEKNAPIIGDAALGRIPWGKPPRGRKNSEAPKNRGTGELR